MKKKVSLAVLIALVIMVAAVQNAYAFHEPIIIAEADPTANIGYTPTELPNGDFEQYPDKGTTSPTGGSDWQTTETQTQTNTGVT